MKTAAAWKYLRETQDSDTSTSLKTCLTCIFPRHEFIYNKIVPKSVYAQRNSEVQARRYKPDARCEELNLIIEVDGLPHYQATHAVIEDSLRDKYFTKFGYKIVRIPYWLQLNHDYIQHIFNIDAPDSCELTYSFFDTQQPKSLQDNPGISVCIGSMCEAGRYRFLQEFANLPSKFQNIVMQDILTCRRLASSPDLVAPEYMLIKLSNTMKDHSFEFDPDDYKSATLLNLGGV